MKEDEKAITPGKNIFLLDGPIGRLQFIKTYAIVLCFCLLILIIDTIVISLFGRTKYTDLTSTMLLALYIIITLYVLWIAYAKRLYDIIGTKDKAIFYATIIFGIRFALYFIDFWKYSSLIFTIIISAILLFKQGKYIKPKQKEKTDEEN